MSSLVDSNVLIDITGDDPVWADWSRDRIADALLLGPVSVNAVIYAEVSSAFRSPDDVDRLFDPMYLDYEDIPPEAAFLAGKAHVEYRRRGGGRARTLPDFLIGAHAQVRGHTLVTRDGRRYRDYFPDLDLIAPDGPSRSAP